MGGPGGSAAPPGGGARPCPLPVAGRRRHNGLPHLLTPESGVPPSGGFSGLRSPLRISLQSPPPYSCSDTPLFAPSPFPAAARRSADTESAAGFRRAFRRPRPLHRGAQQGAGPARGAVGRWRRGLFHCASPAPARRVLPERHGAAAFRAGTKGARHNGRGRPVGARRPLRRPGPCAGGGAPSGERSPGSPPTRPPPLLRPHPGMDVAATRPSVCSGAAATARQRTARTYLGHEFCTLQSRPAPSWGATWGVGGRGAGEWGPRAEGQAGAARGVAGGSRRAPCIFPLSLCVCPCAALSRDVTGLRVSFPHKDTGAPLQWNHNLAPPQPPPQRGTRGTGGGAREVNGRGRELGRALRGPGRPSALIQCRAAPHVGPRPLPGAGAAAAPTVRRANAG